MPQKPSKAVSAKIKEAVVLAYAELNSVPREQVSAGFDGGLEFDSLLGVELACALEERLGIDVPETKLTKSSVYKSLSAFSTVIQECFDAARGT
jgi:acyl carrier protein